MKRSAMLLAALLIAGCGHKDSDKTKDNGGSGSAPAVVQEKLGEIIAKPRKVVTAHAGTTEMTIDLPEDATVRASGDAAMIDFKDSSLQFALTPRATKIAPDELAQKKELSPDGKAKGTEVLVRADQTSADSFAVAKKQKNNTGFDYESCRNVATGSVCCAARIILKEPHGMIDGAIVWADDVCHHLTVQGEPHAAPVAPATPKPGEPLKPTP